MEDNTHYQDDDIRKPLIDDGNDNKETDPNVLKDNTKPPIKGANKTDHSSGFTNNAANTEPSSVVKYVFIVLMCILGAGDYFIEDNPAALQTYILKDLQITETSFALFYSTLSWVSMVSCLISGYVLDKLLGYRIGVIMFLFGLAFSQVLFGCGALLDNYWVMVAGRALIGLCSPMVAISADIISIRWFKRDSLALVLGLRTSIARVASVIQMNVMDRIYERLNVYVKGHECLGLTLISASTVCFISAFAALAIVWMDKKYMKNILNTNEKGGKLTKKTSDWIKDVKSLNALFWLITFSATAFYIGIFPFVAFGQIFYEMKYNVEVSKADTLNSLVYLMAAITLPIFGLISDKLGKNLLLVLVGVCLAIAGHFLMAFTFINPYITTVILGTGYSVTTATVWPLAAYVTEERTVGTAYSIMNTTIVVLQTGVQYLSGYLVDTKGYFILEVFFVFTMSIALLFSCLLYLVDSYKGGVLNLTPKERARVTKDRTKQI